METPPKPNEHLAKLRSFLRGQGLNFGDITGSLGDRELYCPRLLTYLDQEVPLPGNASQAMLTPDKVLARLANLHNVEWSKPATARGLKERFSKAARREADAFPEIQNAIDLYEALLPTDASVLGYDILAGYGLAMFDLHKSLGEPAVKMTTEIPDQLSVEEADALAQQVG